MVKGLKISVEGTEHHVTIKMPRVGVNKVDYYFRIDHLRAMIDRFEDWEEVVSKIAIIL